MGDRALILAGGRGRRLAPYTAILPKPLMPLSNNKSVIQHVLEGIARAGISNVTISLGYLGHLIEAVLNQSGSSELNITYTHEDDPLGTAGPLTLMSGVQDSDRVLVVNGDTYTDLDYRSVLGALDGHQAVVTCVRREIETNYGIIHPDENGNLNSYEEKPILPLLVSTGIYAIRGSAMRDLQPLTYLDMPDLLRTLATDSGGVRVLIADCLWRDLGRAEDFAEIVNQMPEN